MSRPRRDPSKPRVAQDTIAGRIVYQVHYRDRDLPFPTWEEAMSWANHLGDWMTLPRPLIPKRSSR